MEGLRKCNNDRQTDESKHSSRNVGKQREKKKYTQFIEMIFLILIFTRIIQWETSLNQANRSISMTIYTKVGTEIYPIFQRQTNNLITVELIFIEISPDFFPNRQIFFASLNESSILMMASLKIKTIIKA